MCIVQAVESEESQIREKRKKYATRPFVKRPRPFREGSPAL